MKFKTKPCEIEARQFDGKRHAELIMWLRGEFYPCKPDVFALKYEPAE